MALQTDIERALVYHNHERRLSKANGFQELARTHVFEPGDNALPAQDVEARRDSLTVSFKFLYVTGGNGCLFEWGALNIGCGVWVTDDGRMGIGGGQRGVAVPTDTPLEHTSRQSVRGVVRQRAEPWRVTAAWRPGTGETRLWLDGQLVVAGHASKGTFDTSPTEPYDNSRWAGTGPGSYFVLAVNYPRVVPLAWASAPVDIEPASDLSVYLKQQPQHFGSWPLDPIVGGPSLP